MDLSKIKVTNIRTRQVLRKWFENNASKAKELWIPVKVGKPDNKKLYYIDTIEECICFGWIDSTNANHPKYGHIHKLTPRRSNSHWTLLNIYRAKRMINLGLMTELGRKTLPNLNPKLVIYPEIKKIFHADKEINKNFKNFPKLYQEIRIDSIQRYKDISKDLYQKAINNFVKQTKKNKMYGQWNDYGRLN